jgi:hypothetical protein
MTQKAFKDMMCFEDCMKLTIDTSTDSKQEIEQVIRLLQALINSEKLGHSEQLPDYPTGENVLGSLFDSEPVPKKSEEKKDSASSLTFGIQTY